MKRLNSWSPNSLEKKCLHDLDSSENWSQILRRERPEPSEIQGWSPFWRIYVINAALFLVVLAVIFVSLEIGLGGVSDLKEDLNFGAASVAVVACGLALYVTHLYRRSWNRRANYLKFEAEEV